MNKSVIEEINGFSEELYALEEIEFVIRLKKYGQKLGKGFTILHKYPLITSGRKGAYNLSSIFILFASNIVAIGILILYFILPSKWFPRKTRPLLGYWYNKDRS